MSTHRTTFPSINNKTVFKSKWCWSFLVCFCLFFFLTKKRLTKIHNASRLAAAAATLEPHLLQQRSGLLWNRLGDVESRVATDSRWMAPQQGLCRGKEGWKEQITMNQNRGTMWGEGELRGQIHRHPQSRGGGQRWGTETGQIGGGPGARAPEKTLIAATTKSWWFNYCSQNCRACVSWKYMTFFSYHTSFGQAALLEGAAVKKEKKKCDRVHHKELLHLWKNKKHRHKVEKGSRRPASAFPTAALLLK